MALAGILAWFGPNCGRSAAEDDLWELFDLTGTVAAIAVTGREVFIGGKFTAVGGILASNVAKWNGTNWTSLGGGMLGGGPQGAYVFSIAVDDRFVYVGGVITNAGGVGVNGIARWDGTNWQSLGGGVDGDVRALAVSGHDLYAGGSFHSVGGIAANNIARWDGTNWHSLGGGVSWWRSDPWWSSDAGVVRALAMGPGGLYVGGDFREVDGMAIGMIAKWDGTTWSTLGGGLPGYNEGGHALAIQETNVLVGGNLRWVLGQRGPGVARWDGSNWSAIPQADFEGARAIVAIGRNVFVGGGVGQAGTNQVEGLSCWDGTSWSRVGSGVSAGVLALASNGSDLWVGGYQAGGTGLAVYHFPHRLEIERAATNVMLAWPSTGTNLVLEAAEDLVGSNWFPVRGRPEIVGDQVRLFQTLSGPAQFYRLRR